MIITKYIQSGYVKAIFISLISFFIHFQHSNAQDVLSKHVTVTFRNTSIESIIKYIKTTYIINFSYSKSIINLDEKITIQCEDVALSKVLDSMFLNKNVVYIQKSKLIVLLPKPQNIDKIIIKGLICDENNKPIEYAAIMFKYSGVGRITNVDGIFQTIVKKNDLTDTLIISSLGYEKAIVSVANLSKTSSFKIVLKRKTFVLNQVTVSKKKSKSKKSGNNGFLSLGSIYIDTHGQQTVLFIENKDNKQGIIASVNYYLSKDGNVNAPFRVRLYEIDSITGSPGKDMLSEMVIAKPNNKGWFKVNLVEYGIAIPAKGFFAGIEGLYPGSYSDKSANQEDFSNFDFSTNQIPKTISYGQQLGYTRMKGKNTWHFSLANTWFQLEKNNYNVMIYVDLRIER